MEELTLFTAKTADDVIYCLERGDNINEWNREKTPYIYHCENNNIEVVVALIQHNCDVSSSLTLGYSGLELVCDLGHSNLLREMLQYANVRALLNPIDSITTPLFEVCRDGHTDIFDILVEYGADINLPAIDGYTPLMEACSHSNEDIVKRLLQLGVKVNQRSYSGTTAIFYCENVNILHLLYNYGADINIQDNKGNTPLLYFIHIVGEYNIMEALINLNPDLNITNNIGETALINAVILGDITIVEKLLEANADVTISDNRGNTALYYITIQRKFTLEEKEELINLFNMSQI